MSKIEKLDFRPITYSGLRACIKAEMEPYGPKETWIETGNLKISSSGEGSLLRRTVESQLDSVCDPEHDPCKAFSFSVIGLQFVFSMSATMLFEGVIDPTRAFCVPGPDYDPAKTHGEPCSHCKGDEAHLLVPDGFYMPPKNPELFRQMAGKTIEIWIYSYKEEE
jgi:hypothetical protein